MIVLFTEILILISHVKHDLFLKFTTPCKGLDGICHLSRFYVVVKKYTQMICWIFGTGLPSLKQQKKNKHEFSNSSPTSQGKKSQLFLTVL